MDANWVPTAQPASRADLADLGSFGAQTCRCAAAAGRGPAPWSPQPRPSPRDVLEALFAAVWAGDLGSPGGLLEAAEAARAAPPGPQPPRAVDVLLDAVALRLTQGYAAAAPALSRDSGGFAR